MPIQVLPENLVKRIAAGEVIERPVSIVKELIENSIDAKATRIDIKIEEGGIESITIIDNGSGILRDDISKLLHRHSTSKINTEADLEEISTLGFRGEALYSIASVTKLRIRTRNRDENEGTELISEDGKVSINTISAPQGTTIEASGLFHNTPARKKFLKSFSAEYGRIAEVVSRYVLAYPGISFELSHNGRKTLQSLGGSPQDPLIALWGAKVTSEMLPIDFRVAGVRITGFVSTPQLTRSTRKDITIFINGRLIKDPSLTMAVERPFHMLIPAGRHPVAIIKIQMPPSDVDVNVHPNKREVRLSNPKAMFSDVHAAIDRALSLHRPLKEPDNVSVQERFDRKPSPPPGTPPPKNINFEPETGEMPAEVVFMDQEIEDRSAPQTEPLFLGEVTPKSIQRGEVMIYLDTYLVFENNGELVMVDFHNMHERIIFEEMDKAEKSRGDAVLTQKMMFPENFTVPPELALIIEDESEFINRMGFEVEPFGSGVFLLRGIPHFLKGSNASQILIDILTEVNDETGSAKKTSDFTQKFKASAACKAAVKAGAKLKAEEIDFIIRHTGDARFMTCPHGRPTLIKLDRHFFDSKFKRKSHQ